jgi:methylated-DNA-[protein]-cysteine S-methyltransferase
VRNIPHTKVEAAGRRLGTLGRFVDLRAKLGCPQSVRAVGLANGANPISVVVPCHRVIGANGSLTGYGGGIERKGIKKIRTVPEKGLTVRRLAAGGGSHERTRL